MVAYINLFCYYLMGLPLGFFLGYKGGYRVEVRYIIISCKNSKITQKYISRLSFISILLTRWSNPCWWKILFQGIWVGMICGTVLQTAILIYIIYKTNWNKEVRISAYLSNNHETIDYKLNYYDKKNKSLWLQKRKQILIIYNGSCQIFRLNKHLREWRNGLDKILKWVTCRKKYRRFKFKPFHSLCILIRWQNCAFVSHSRSFFLIM